MIENIKHYSRQLVNYWSKDKVSTLSAAFAFYTLFSIPPLLVICLTLVGIIMGKTTAEHQIMGGIASVIGPASSQQLTQMVQGQSSLSASILTNMIIIAVIIIGAIGFYSQLVDGLNDIFEVELKTGFGWRALILERIFAYIVVLFIVLLLFLSIILGAGIMLFHDIIHLPFLFEWLHLAISIILIYLFFLFLYQFIPSAKLPLKFSSKGAIFASILLIIIKYLLSLYLAHASYASRYGIAGSILVILLWLYCFGIIIFMGAEFIKVDMKNKAILIKPKEKSCKKT